MISIRRFTRLHSFAAAALAAVTLVLLVTASCSTKRADERTLTVSILPQKYLLEAITGDKYKVQSLLNASADPETYDPSMSHLMNVERSDAYFRVGHIGFEEAISRRIAASCPGLRVVDTSRGIELLRGTHGPQGSPVDSGILPEVDPHVWTSITNARIMARNMASAVCEIDPPNAAYYESNLQALDSRLDSIQRLMTQRLSGVKHRAFAVWHPSLSYFARECGLRQMTLGEEHKDLSAAMLKERIDSIRAAGALVLVEQRETDSRQAMTVAEELGLVPQPVNTLAYDWPDELLQLASALAAASGSRR